MNNTSSKIKSKEELLLILRELRNSGKKIVTTNGAFDLLHVGHIDIMEKSAALGDVFVVLVNSDSSVKMNKGEVRPVVPLNQRMRVLAALEVVTYVCAFEEKTPLQCLDHIAPDVHTKGGDYVLEELPEKKVVESHGGTVVIIDLTSDSEDKVATTRLIDKIKNINL